MKNRNFVFVLFFGLLIISCVMREEMRFKEDGKIAYSYAIDFSQFMEKLKDVGTSEKVQKEFNRDTLIVFKDLLNKELPDSLSEEEKAKIRKELTILQNFRFRVKMRNLPNEKSMFSIGLETDDVDLETFFDRENPQSLTSILKNMDGDALTSGAPGELEDFQKMYIPVHKLTKKSFTKSYELTARGKEIVDEQPYFLDSLRSGIENLSPLLFGDSLNMKGLSLLKFEQSYTFPKRIKSFQGYSARLSQDRKTVTTTLSPWDIYAKGDSANLVVNFE